MPLTPLHATLTKLASVSPLDATLARPSYKSIKTRDFNPIRCHTYEVLSRKSCRINTYKKQGVGWRAIFGRVALVPERFPIPSGGGPEGTRRTPLWYILAARESRNTMTPFDRIIWTVLDSVGIGALPDAAAYGDAARNTLGNKPTSGTEILIDGEVCCLG